MSSTFPSRQDPPSRTWWSLSSKIPHTANAIPYSDSAKSSRQSLPKSSGLNFNSIASAIGFKSKKHPTLAIQSPPETVTSVAVGSAKYHNRPPSKSVSSVVSHAGSLESQSPAGGRKHTRQSLLTLSDADPFRRGGTSAHPTHASRFSVHSNSSITELGPKLKGRSMLNRISSSSSQSPIHHGSELSPSSATQSPTSTPELPTHKLSPKRSVGSLHRKRSLRPPDGSLISAWDSLTQSQPATISKSTSLSTLTDKNRFSQPEPVLHPPPPMRPRGMTDSKANQLSSSHQQKLSYTRNSPSTNSPTPGPSTSPRVIVRQASMSRIGSPPSAPPMHELPPPPRVNDARENDPYIIPDASAASGSSSSSLSFASSLPSNKEPVLIQPHNTLSKTKRSSEHILALSIRTEVEHSGNRNPKTSHCTLTPGPLKKALSHQSLSKRGSSSSSPDRTSATPPPERTVEKVPRKQRSFHQQKSSKFSIPPARHTNSSGSQSPISVNDSVPLTDQRRDSAGAISPGRKRLFSGSNLRRPSIAQHVPSEDDALSIFSVRSEQDYVPSLFKSVSPTASSSFWDEGIHDHIPDSPRGVGHEYTPQQIMSPAEMAKVEASVEESSVHGRARLSVLSVSSATSDGSESVASGSLSLSTWHSRTSITPQRTTSLLLTGLTVPRRLAVRPSTSDAHVTEPSTQSTSPKPSSPPQIMTSLPPPPRPRTRPPIVTQVVSEDESSIRTPSPLMRRSLFSKASIAEKSFTHQSVMKKPSFLEIDDDDDTDKESEGETPGEPLHGSFLDLARESFDTVRSVVD